MKKLPILLGILGILAIGGAIAQTGPNWEPNKSHNMTLNITCTPNQVLFSCPCHENVKFRYQITNYWNESKQNYANYTAQLNVNGQCIQGKREATIAYANDPHDAILLDLQLWLSGEYNLNRQKPAEKTTYGGGTIKVVK